MIEGVTVGEAVAKAGGIWIALLLLNGFAILAVAYLADRVEDVEDVEA